MAVAYDGKEPYIFISYSHKDTAMVLNAVEALNDNGFRVWYDNGIEAGTEWPEYIAERLMSSKVVIAFMSKNSQDSHNCRREIHFAIELKKELLVIYLEDFELSPGMRLQLSALQAMFKYKYSGDADFLSHLCNAAIVQQCRAADFGSKVNHTPPKEEPIRNSKPKEEPAKPRYSAPRSSVNNRNAVIAAINACNEALKIGKFAFFFTYTNELTPKQIDNSIRVITKNKITKNDIIAVMDDTVFSSAKSGYVVTEDHFYCAGLSLASFDFSLSDLRGVSSPSKSHLLLRFADGSERDLFFNNYYLCFQTFFETYLNTRGL